jgi:hypothetical protein
MKTLLSAGILMLGLAGSALAASDNEKAAAGADTPWSMNASIIEACSCPMFCQCYFATKPAAHAVQASDGHDHGASEHYCRANNVFKVNKGMYGKTKLDGAKFWAAMDLGDDFSDGEMKWAVLTFDPSVTPAQREGISKVLGALYPVKWQSFEVASDLPIEWTHDGDRAVAKLDGGKAGEVVLNGAAVNRNMSTPSRHDGFVLMPNEVEAYRIGPNAFEYKGTNGFMITFDINSKDVAPAAKSGM